MLSPLTYTNLKETEDAPSHYSLCRPEEVESRVVSARNRVLYLRFFLPNVHAGPAIHAVKIAYPEVAWGKESFKLLGWTSYSLSQRKLIEMSFVVTFLYPSN